jgi:diguanylate cyclase (GGDEF)-like protein
LIIGGCFVAWSTLSLSKSTLAALLACCLTSAIAFYKTLDKRRYKTALYYAPEDELAVFFRGYDGYIKSYNRNFRRLFRIPDGVETGKIPVELIRIAGSKTPQHIRNALAGGHGGATGIIHFKTLGIDGSPKRVIAHTTGIFRETGIEIILRDCHEAFIDPLTECFRKSVYLDFWSRSFSEERTLHTAIMISLDAFSRMNNEYGFAAGDQILKQVGTRINHAFSLSDVVVRFSGAVFLVLIRHIENTPPPKEKADQLASELNGFYHLCLAEESTTQKSLQVFQSVTIVVSETMWVESICDLKKIVEQAEKLLALQHAKASSKKRNSAVLSEGLRADLKPETLP